MRTIKLVLYILVGLIVFFFNTLPSLVYSIFPHLLIPLGWLIQLLMHKPAFSYNAGIIALRLGTIVLLVIIPSVLNLYVSGLLGWLFFAWIGLYLLIRIYSGVHGKEREAIRAWKHLDALTLNTYTKKSLVITFITIILTAAALASGYYLDRAQALLIGAVISVIVWCISPFVK